MSWAEDQHRVTRSFNDWILVDFDIRAFLRNGLDFSHAEYDRIWKESGEEASEDGFPEHIDVFEKRVNYLHGYEFDWMLLSAVLRDAVSNFESYLEKGREEILRFQGPAIEIPDNLPYWHEFKTFYRRVGVEIDSADVRRVRALRGFLTHRRGELRTEALRKEFHGGEPWDLNSPLSVELTAEGVVADLDTLGVAVRTIDATAYDYTWGRHRLPE